MAKITRSLLTGGAMIALAACSTASNPTAQDATKHLTKIYGDLGWFDVSISNCSGDATRTSCTVAYKYTAATSHFYEEAAMDFVKTPSGWAASDWKRLDRRKI